MKKLILTILLCLFVAPLLLTAQDMIYKKNNDTIFCIVREVGTEEITYNLLDYSQMVLFAIEKEKVAKVVFSDGQVIEFQKEKEIMNAENYADNRKSAIKIDIISPLTGNTTFSFEQSLKPGRSIEVSLGLIGLGFDPNENDPLGLFLEFGFKLIKNPDYYTSKMRYSHLLNGGYIKPEVSFGVYGVNSDYYYTTTERETVLTGTVMVDFGKQWVFNNTMLFDLYVGVGYGFSSRGSSSDMTYDYGWATGPPQVPIALTAGINIGYLIK